jgi:hypothetical protein
MAKNTLTDTQRVVLAAAAARESGLVLPLPTSLGNNRGTHGIILKSLIERKLLTERPAQPGETVWRETEDFVRMTLSIAAAGLEAIGIAAVTETGSLPSDLDVTAERIGRSSGDVVEAAAAKQQLASAATNGSNAGAATGPRAGSKLAILIGLLRRPAGATIPDLTEATGWLAHSIRGAISGALKKKLSLEVSSEATTDRGRVYRVVSASDGGPSIEGSQGGASGDTPQVTDGDQPTSGAVA